MAIAQVHARIFLGFPPKESTLEIVHKLDVISTRETFKTCIEVKKKLLGSKFWEFVSAARTVSDQVTKDVINNHVEYHMDHENLQKS